MKNVVFWNVTPCGLCKNIVFLRNLCRFLVTANVVPSPPILVTLTMESIRSYKSSVLKRTTRCNIPEDFNLHSTRHENLKSYIVLTGWALWRRRNVSSVRY
jgi:hypothetical protein